MPIMIDMEKPKCCEINDYAMGEFVECPLLYDANDCKLSADTRRREWLEGWAIESDNCPLKEIVLCKDCKYFREGSHIYPFIYQCWRTTIYGNPVIYPTTPEDFCSRGEEGEE